MDAMSIIWHDNWIAGVGPLPMHVESFNRDTLPRVSVATMLDVHDMWNWSLFQHLLPLLVLIRIATVNELDPLFPEDTIEWSLASDSCNIDRSMGSIPCSSLAYLVSDSSDSLVAYPAHAYAIAFVFAPSLATGLTSLGPQIVPRE
ncbi:hypothetical protein V6N13_054430 [Hibiscus sabdariffa]